MKKINPWKEIPIEFPKIGIQVLIVDLYSPYPIIEVGEYLGDNDWKSYRSNVVNPSHWASIPELPIWDAK